MKTDSPGSANIEAAAAIGFAKLKSQFEPGFFDDPDPQLLHLIYAAGVGFGVEYGLTKMEAACQTKA